VIASSKQVHGKEHANGSGDFSLKNRIRFNRANQLVIDRYIQTPYSFSPFDDDFNIIVKKYKTYKEDFGKMKSKFIISVWQ